MRGVVFVPSGIPGKPAMGPRGPGGKLIATEALGDIIEWLGCRSVNEYLRLSSIERERVLERATY